MRGAIRVAIVGVGNCASSLIQGVEFYKDVGPDDPDIPGLMNNVLGGYKVGDIEFVAAFDVDDRKVGEPLCNAIFKGENCTTIFEPDISRSVGGLVKVQRGRTLDGLGKYLKEVITKAPGPSVDVVQVLKDSDADVLVNYLPVGSEEATKFYMEAALQAGVAVINCIPVFIASDKTGYWPDRFVAAGLPIIGDDIKSQVGATIVHRVLTNLFEMRGVKLDETYQLNFGGNTDFLNMLERERLESKKVSKTGAVTSQMSVEPEERNIHVGPSDHVPWLEDRKWCYIHMAGTTFGDVPLKVEVKLEVVDSPNSAGVVIDAIRYIALALDRGLSGPVIAPSAYLMKTPPRQFTDAEAHDFAWSFAIPNVEFVELRNPTTGDLLIGASRDKY